jgi:membrane-associated protease RseP (regulator of RpoE activity)
MTDIQDSQHDQDRSLPPPTGRPLATSGGSQPVPPPSTGNSAVRLAILLALLVLVGVAWGWAYVVVIGALVVMIFMHELGHYLTAKRAGMKVTEFFIGFGPRLTSWRRGEVEYGVKAIPAGAYVKIIGMSNLDEVDPAEEDRTYRSKPLGARLSVAVAGSAMHFLMALVLLFIMLVGFGMPKADNWLVASPSPDSPATAVGLQKDDRIVAIDGQNMKTFDELTNYVRAHPGAVVTLTVLRNGQTVTLQPTLATQNPQGEHVGFLGIGRRYPYEKTGPLAAVPQTFVQFGDVTSKSITGLVKVFSPGGIRHYVESFNNQPSGTSDPNRLVSPVGAVQMGASLARNGAADLLFFLAAINIFIGIFNLVPLPPFDGGHVAVALYESVRSRKGKRYYADVRKLMPVAYTVLAILLVMFVGNLYLDLTRPIVP